MSSGGTIRRGQALIEFALILPLLFLLILNLVNFGAFIHAMIGVANAARTGAQYMIMGNAWAGTPIAPSTGQIETIVRQDASALPNSASLIVAVCKDLLSNGACGPLDPDPNLYVLGTVDVTYTYQPLIPGWDFPGLGIHLTLPPTTVHRRAVMRMVQ